MKQPTTTENLTRRFEALRPNLRRWASRLLGNEDDVDDALQEAFFKLWRSKETMGHQANIEAMSFTALRSSCIDALRRRSLRRAEPIEAADKQTAPEAEEMADMAEEVRGLIESRLDPRAREIMLLHDSLGYGYDEISAKLGLSEANTRLILSRSRKTIREAYRQRRQATP